MVFSLYPSIRGKMVPIRRNKIKMSIGCWSNINPVLKVQPKCSKILTLKGTGRYHNVNQ